MPLKFVRNNSIQIHADAVVITANGPSALGSMPHWIHHQQAGRELLSVRKKISTCTISQTGITPVFYLPCRYIIHTAGPVWQGDTPKKEREQLRQCYIHSLELATKYDCSSVVFPLISAGACGCPADIAMDIAIQTIRAFLENHELDVYLVLSDWQSFRLNSELFQDITEFIDKTYVRQAVHGTWGGIYSEKLYSMDVPSDSNRSAKEEKLSKCHHCECKLPDLLNHMEEPFSVTLLHLIDRDGETDPVVYKRANVDRKLFSKIRNNPNYQPKKTTALAFAVALRLNLDETKALIGKAGYALSHSNKSDIIVEYFITHGEYDIFTINETLFAFKQPLLGC